jgi:type I restriction enzyme S subunit
MEINTIKSDVGMSWEMVTIKDIAVNLDNKRKPLNESERNKISKKQLYPYIGANNIMGYVDEFLFDEEIICIAEDGGSWGENQKCCTYVQEKCWVNNHAHVLASNGKSDLKYLMYYLNAKDLNKYITGTTRGKLTKSALDSIQIPLPPLPIQKRIAEILDAADALKRKDLQLIQKYDELAQAIFIDMFGDPVKNEKGWEVKKGFDLIKVIGGAAFKSSDYIEEGIPLVRIGTINKGYFDKNQLVFLPKNFKTTYKKYLIYPNDLVITLTGTVGKDDYGNVFIMEDDYPEYLLNQRVAKLKINEELLSKRYFEFILKQKEIKAELTGVSRGVRQANISNNDIYELNINTPPIELQLLFDKLIDNLSASNLKNSKSISDILFQTLIQKAFKGELVS